MFFNVDYIIQNPLLILGIIFLLTIFIYLVVEFWQIRRKTKEQQGFILAGWGAMMIIFTVVLLFTTAVSFVGNSFSEGKDQTYTLYELKGYCDSGKLAELKYVLYLDDKASCRIIMPIAYVCLIFFILGPIFIVFGLIIKVLYVKESLRQKKEKPKESPAEIAEKQKD